MIGPGGAGGHHVDNMCVKAVRKTGEIAHWSNTHSADLTLASKLWLIYVFRSLIYGAATLPISTSSLAKLDRAQRKCDRLLLGFSSRCPAACVLAELGWHRLSSAISCERWRLLRKLYVSENWLVQTVLECSLGDSTSWLYDTVVSLRPWSNGELPESKYGWSRLIQQGTAQIRFNEAAEIANSCARQNNLSHYRPTRYHCEGTWEINRLIHSPSVDISTARKISRLLAGGQGLRGGDARASVIITRHNCCVFAPRSASAAMRLCGMSRLNAHPMREPGLIRLSPLPSLSKTQTYSFYTETSGRGKNFVHSGTFSRSWRT